MENPFVINVGTEGGKSIPEVSDVIIIGGGPAGLAAALYTARAGLSTLVLEKLSVGGQIFLTYEVENYPGIEKITGPELIKAMENQALAFGTVIHSDEVLSIAEAENGLKEIKGASGTSYKAISVIIASGASYRDLGVPGETDLKGRGVSNCATCDGAFYRNVEVAVVGGGDTAVEEGIFLTKFASKVHVIHRRDKLRAIKTIQDRAFANPKMNFIFDSVVEEIKGERGVESLVMKNIKTNASSVLAVKGVFVFIGLVPHTGFLKGTVEMDAQGYIKADSEMKTSVKGIFAAGDCIQKSLRQVVTAAGDGAVAADTARHYVEKIKGF